MSGSSSISKYTVFADTNTLYSRKPSQPISQTFLRSLGEARKVAVVDVLVPAVVVDELAYRQFRAALESVEKLQGCRRVLRDTCLVEIADCPSKDELEQKARMVVVDLLTANKVTILPTPIEQIAWSQVIDDSCWRRPPFSRPADGDEEWLEKGFRDKVILETIKVQIASGTTHETIAFISGDDLLQSAFANQVRTDRKIEQHKNMVAFSNEIQLRAKANNDEFVRAVMSRVNPEFYNSDAKSGIAVSKKVFETLLDCYAALMEMLYFGCAVEPEPVTAFGLVRQSHLNLPIVTIEEANMWKQVSGIQFAAGHASYVSSKDARYHWQSTVELARLFRRTKSTVGIYSLPDERILRKSVDVGRSSEIDLETLAFTSPSIDSYSAPTDRFIVATTEARVRYRFPLFAGLPLDFLAASQG